MLVFDFAYFQLLNAYCIDVYPYSKLSTWKMCIPARVSLYLTVHVFYRSSPCNIFDCSLLVAILYYKLYMLIFIPDSGRLPLKFWLKY